MKIASDQNYLAYLFPVNFSYHVQTNHCHEQEETFLLLLRYVGQLIISTHARIYGTPTHTHRCKKLRRRVISIIICLHGDPKHHFLGWEYTLYFLTLEIVTYFQNLFSIVLCIYIYTPLEVVQYLVQNPKSGRRSDIQLVLSFWWQRQLHIVI